MSIAYGVTIDRNSSSSGTYGWHIIPSYVTLTTGASTRYPAVAQRWMGVTNAASGIYVEGTHATVNRVDVYANLYHGIELNYADYATVENCLLRNSTSNASGSGIDVTSDYVTLRNNTVYGNGKYRIYMGFADSVLENNIVWADGEGKYALYIPAYKDLPPPTITCSMRAMQSVGYCDYDLPTLDEWRRRRAAIRTVSAGIPCLSTRRAETHLQARPAAITAGPGRPTPPPAWALIPDTALGRAAQRDAAPRK